MSFSAGFAKNSENLDGLRLRGCLDAAAVAAVFDQVTASPARTRKLMKRERLDHFIIRLLRERLDFLLGYSDHSVAPARCSLLRFFFIGE